MRVELRVVSGSLRGRKLVCQVNEQLRPTPQKVREALFSLLTNVIKDRRFIDIFSGTGINGLEAISRGASMVTFVERDFRLTGAIQAALKQYNVNDRAMMVRTDTYRWIERWLPPKEPVNVFISPPFVDFQRRPEALVSLLEQLQTKVAEGSVVILQGEHEVPLMNLPRAEEWDDRRYGRNHLLIWKKPETEIEETEETEEIEEKGTDES